MAEQKPGNFENFQKYAHAKWPNKNHYWIESHGSASSSRGLEDSNHEEEEEEVPTATSNIKMLSCIRLGKHKAKLKQNAIVSH